MHAQIERGVSAIAEPTASRCKQGFDMAGDRPVGNYQINHRFLIMVKHNIRNVLWL